MENHHQVLIVGGGPVGLALAVELGQRGVDCAVIERHLAPVRIPKGQSLSNRTLEHFYFWQCVDQLRAARVMPPGYPIGGVTCYRDLLSPYWHAAVGGGRRGPQVQDYYFQRNERLPQYCTEEVLRNRLKELPSVTTMFGWTAETIAQDDNGVSVTITPASESPFYSWSADPSLTSRPAAAMGEGARLLRGDYLVGCDGGRSLVRESMGIDRSGRVFDQRMVLAVLRSRELHERLRRFPECTTFRVMKPELQGYWQFFGRIDVGEGFFFHSPVSADAQPTTYDFHRLLYDAAGFQFQVELDYVGFWDLRILTASRYREGRVFIAGDACHQHPPYGGFGLNTGLEDAVNLGWKLAATLQGWGSDRLLDSYSEERRPIFYETGEVIAGGIERDRKFLERYSPEKNRAEFEEAWADFPNRAGQQRESYEPHYEGSPIVVGPPDGICSIHGRYSFKAEAGHHLSPRGLSSGRNVFEELGPGFTLLAFGPDGGAVSAFEAAAAARCIPLKVVRDSYEDERTAYEASLVLVRPDQYVAWAAEQPPSDPSRILACVTGQS